MNSKDAIKLMLKKFGLLKACRRLLEFARRVFCTRDLWLFYMSAANLKPYLREFRAHAKRLGFNDESGREKWCEYMVVLRELGRNNEFDKVFAEYIAGGEENVKMLTHYLPLACEAEKRGIKDEEIVRAARVCRAMMNCHVNNSLGTFVKGKTIAVVGNGPSEIGKGLGPEIDAHDYVIRINNHTIKGFENDYGTRTDIWAKHTTDYIKHEVPDDKIRLIIYASNWMREKMPTSFLDAIEHDLKNRIVDFCAMENRAAISDRFMIHPLTGTLVLDILYRSQMKYADAYGFSFLESDGGGYRHYMNDMSAQKLSREVSVHNTDLETAYLKSLFKGGRRLQPLNKGDYK